MEIPVYIQEERGKGGSSYLIRPLFFEGAARRGELLGPTLNRVAQDVRALFTVAGNSSRHDELLAMTFSPELSTETVDVSLLLRHRTMRCRLMIACFKAPAGLTDADDGRRVAFSPTLPEVWFDIHRDEDPLARAKEVYADHFRAQEKELGDDFAPPAAMETFVRGWVSPVEFDFVPAQRHEKPASLLAALMGQEKMNGQSELQRVGRRLDSLYPDSLDRAVLREPEVAELTRLLSHEDKRPVLLVGPPLVGKSTLIHEYIFRRRKALAQPGEYRGSLWLISPQRLISGMMYAGQWENRLLAILDHLKETGQVLYLDDLPGMYHAGISAQSDLSAAQVLRPYIERRDVRVVAEITPQSLRVLQERDRAFADLFHIVHVREPAERDARRILLSVIREQEALHRARLEIEVLPTVLELQARYVRDLALPGKAAVVLKDLAAKYRGARVGRAEVLREFHARSGLSVGFLDRRAQLKRAEVEKALREQVVGQDAAVAAMADTVGVAKAQLNDTGRPLGSFLFAGPTGVGKTQAAKALAQFLFSDAERLVRFDMNEFPDPYAASRLVGTWNSPEGLLTSAVRRNPFCVVLFDEIEKADPAVFDLLLQVLGEGRLTDALGRTTDFANALIIMTSNLGVSEAQRRFGFKEPASEERAAQFRRAPQEFFRPEFFNRIDRIVPFDTLSRAHTAAIANELIADVLGRQGLQQRKCMLAVAPAAMERIVDAGYHPELGARALRRAIEKQLTHPVAARLAAIEPGTPTLIEVLPEAGDGVGVRVRALPYAERLPLPSVDDAAATTARIDDAMDRLHEVLQSMRPKGRLTIGAIAPEHVRYFALKEQFDRIEKLLEHFDSAGSKSSHAPHPRGPQKSNAVKRSKVNFRALLAAHDLRQHLQELAQETQPPVPEREQRLHDLVRELALLDAMANSTRHRLALLIRPLGGAGGGKLLHTAPVFRFFTRLPWKVADLSRELRAKGDAALPAQLLYLEHAAAERFAATERGIHLVIGTGHELHPVQVTPLLLGEHEEPLDRALSHLKQPDASSDEQILRIFDRDIVDLRSGLICRATDAAAKKSSASSPALSPQQAMLFAALPLPPELER